MENLHWLNIMSPSQYEWVESMLEGKDVVFASIHGSWLYGLQREGSDIDIKVIYAPSKSDLLVGDANKTYSKKHPELDIEMEIKSLSSFLKSAKSCDTNVIDLLHTPKRLTLFSSPMWDCLRSYRKNLYAKNMKGLIGYIKTHTSKYTKKIDRYDEMVKLSKRISHVLDEVKLKDTTIPAYVDSMDFKYIKNVKVKSDYEQHYIEVCGKKYILTWESKLLKDALHAAIERYGTRTHQGSGSGLDGKSLSHALRVLLQLKQILTDNDLSFPLKDSGYLLKVKLGEVTDPTEVSIKIAEEYDICMKLIEESDLPEEVDTSPMLLALEDYYFKEGSWLK